jgi:hypothetical protein
MACLVIDWLQPTIRLHKGDKKEGRIILTPSEVPHSY